MGGTPMAQVDIPGATPQVPSPKIIVNIHITPQIQQLCDIIIPDDFPGAAFDATLA